MDIEYNRVLNLFDKYNKAHEHCEHECVLMIAKHLETCCGEFEDCGVGCYYEGEAIYCCLFSKIAGNGAFQPMSDDYPENGYILIPIMKHTS